MPQNQLHIPMLSSILRYFPMYRRYTRARIFFLLLLTFVCGLMESFGIALFVPLLAETSITAESTDRVSEFFSRAFHLLGVPQTLYMLFAAILVIFFVKGLLKFIEGAYKAHLTAGITRDVRNRLVHQLGSMNYRHYVDGDTGAFSSLITLESNRVVLGFGRFCNVLIKLITIAVFVFGSLWINWRFTIVTIVLGTATLYVLRFVSTLTKKYSLQTSREYSALNSLIIQALHAFKYMKATNGFTVLQKKLLATIARLSRQLFRTQVLAGLLGAITEPLVILFIVGLLFLQAVVLRESIGPIVISIMFFYRIFQNIMQLQSEWQVFASCTGGLETLAAFSGEIERHRERAGTERLAHFKSGITLEAVGFAYNDRAVLKNISCRIEKNSTVAFAGESGAGKTTLVDIITGILVPRRGRILVDLTQLHLIRPADWRKRIGYVTQDPILFNDSIANNICLWACDSSREPCLEKIKAAAASARCDRFIENLEQGYHTPVGDKGVKLSGGQRQRIAIARELFKEPELLILDEATSSLDTESEAAIQKSISGLKGKITVILIAHRLSTIRNADYIYVMNDARIVEEGTFDDLMADERSRFRKMCALQNIE